VSKTRIKTIIIVLIGLSIGSSIFYYFVTTDEKVEITNSSNNSYFYDEYVNYYDQKIRGFETTNQYGNQIRKDCGIDKHCIVENMQKLGNEQSSETVLQTLNDLTSVYTEFQMFCHPQGHHLGLFLYGYLGNVTKAISVVDRSCGGSLYHGVLENYVRTEIFFEGASTNDIKINEICNLVGDLNIQTRTECHHGVGHALTVIYDYDVFSAVKRCDEFNDKWEQNHCFQGVFMENTQEIMENRGGAIDEGDILYPCNALEEKFAHPCFYHHTTFILQEKGSIEEAFKVCNQVQPSSLAKRCYLGLGRQIAVGFFGNMEKLSSVCEKGHPEYLTYCYAGALLSVLDDMGTDEGLKTCKAFPEKEKSRCYSILGKWVYQMYPTAEERQAQCSKAETNEYFGICIIQVADV